MVHVFLGTFSKIPTHTSLLLSSPSTPVLIGVVNELLTDKKKNCPVQRVDPVNIYLSGGRD